MSGRKNIVALGPERDAEESPQTEPSAVVESAVPNEEAEWFEEEAPARDTMGWVAPVLAVLAIAGWTAFFTFAHRGEMLAGAAPQQWTGWITEWSVPVLLVVALWLLALRHSRREASRFADVARSLSEESARLERRLTTVNRELSLAREFIAAQARDLESLGRVASDRLSQNADRLAGLISDNGERIDQIAGVSNTALENMGRLRDELPVIANSARDVTNQIGNVGHKATSQLEELVSGFARLNEFGQVSEKQVDSLRQRIDAALANFEEQANQLERIASERFEALGHQSQEFRSQLADNEAEALASLRHRTETLSVEITATRSALEQVEEEAIASLRERVGAMSDDATRISSQLRAGEDEAAERWRATVDRLQEHMRAAIAKIADIDAGAMDNARKRLAALHEEAKRVDETMIERTRVFDQNISQRRKNEQERQVRFEAELEDRLAALDMRISERQEEHLAHMAGLDERGEALGQRIAGLGERMTEVSRLGQSATQSIAAAIDRLAELIRESRGSLEGTDRAIAELTDASVRLLEIIQAGARHSKEDLPSAIAIAEQRLTDFEGRTAGLNLLMGEASNKGQELSDYVLSAQQNASSALQDVEALQQNVSTHAERHAEQLATLQAALDSLNEASGALSERAQGELREAISALQVATRQVLEELGTNATETVHGFAETVARESGEALDRALRLRTTESIGQLEQAAAHASGVSREAAIQLRDQLAKVAELTSNLETRVAQAKERAEEQVDNDFSRRMALITESLNSNAIDVAKALSNEVSDTAWASYLRGDRGIFTRRAVRLLENTEAKTVAEIYESDREFREHVSRYIHDFESMLRSMLSTRDGKALAVTILSSDMGKLYVALAQAIERLRD